MNIKKYLTLITFYLISFNVYSHVSDGSVSMAFEHCELDSGLSCVAWSQYSNICTVSGAHCFNYSETCLNGVDNLIKDCAAPSVTCNSGTPETYTYPSPSEMTICIGSCSEEREVNGCTYSANSEDCTRWIDTLGNSLTTCTGFNSGLESPTGVDDNATVDPSNLPTEEQVNDPCTDINGMDICSMPPEALDCYEINGVKTCLSTIDNCGTIGDPPVLLCKNDPINCGTMGKGEDKKAVCITEQVPTLNTTCMAFGATCANNNPTTPVHFDNGVNSMWVTDETGIKERDQTTVTTNIDGTTTTTQVKSTNVSGDNVETTTTETNPDGSTSSETQNSEPDAVAVPSSNITDSVSGAGAALDTFLTAIPSDDGDSFGEGSFISWAFPDLSGSCQSIPMNMNTPWVSINYTFDPCLKLEPMRRMIGWMLYITTVLTLIYIVTKPKSI